MSKVPPDYPFPLTDPKRRAMIARDRSLSRNARINLYSTGGRIYLFLWLLTACGLSAYAVWLLCAGERSLMPAAMLMMIVVMAASLGMGQLYFAQRRAHRSARGACV